MQAVAKRLGANDGAVFVSTATKIASILAGCAAKGGRRRHGLGALPVLASYGRSSVIFSRQGDPFSSHLGVCVLDMPRAMAADGALRWR